MTVPAVRSLLFVPGNRPDWVAKGVAAGADGVVLDLEDAVPAGAKTQARRAVAGYLAEAADAGGPAVPVLVRVNGLADRGVLDDLTAIVGHALTGVMVPKVESVADVAVVDRLLGWLERDAGLPVGSVAIVPALETAAGIRAAHDLALACGDRVAYMGGLGAKGGDVERALGYRWTRGGAETFTLRSRVLLDVRAAGVPNPVTGLWADVGDLEGLRAFAVEGRGLGYEGMLAIHPSHVPVINDCFTPTADELDADAELVAAMERAAAEGRGAVVHDGNMIDEAMAATARRRLARYRG